MIFFSEAQIAAWLSPLIWPFVRVLALFTTAPVFSQKVIPMRLKVGLAFLIALCAQPILGDQTVVSIASPQALGTGCTAPQLRRPSGCHLPPAGRLRVQPVARSAALPSS